MTTPYLISFPRRLRAAAFRQYFERISGKVVDTGAEVTYNPHARKRQVLVQTGVTGVIKAGVVVY